MTVTTQDKLGAYTSRQQSGGQTDREIEARALLSCASRLKAAIDDDGKDMPAYAAAIRHNQRLWTMFQVALCDPENPLPQALKMILLNLSRYVDRVSFRAIDAFKPQLLLSLIDINRAIATGLNKKPALSAEQAAAATQTPMVNPPMMNAPVSIATSA